MADFPSGLIPADRVYIHGSQPVTTHDVYDGEEVRIQHSNAILGITLRLSFTELTTAELITVRDHFRGQLGGHLTFNVPSVLFASETSPGAILPAGYAWHYVSRLQVSETPQPVGAPSVKHDVSFEIEAVPPEVAVAPGARLRAFASFVGGSAALGALWEVYTLLDTGTGASDPPPTPTDEFFQFLALLLPLNGTNGSTSFPDVSPNNFTATANGGAAITTSVSKFDGSSLRLDGAGDYLTIPTNPEFDLGAGSFTLEAHVRADSFSGDWFIISAAGSGGMFFGAEISQTPDGWGVGRAAVAWDNIFAATPAIDTFYHVALCRDGSNLRLFVDGVQVGSTVTNTQSYNLSTGGLCIGSQGAALYWPGYMNAIRITRYKARYVADFTPPTASFPTIGPAAAAAASDANLMLLAPFNGTNGQTTFTDFSGYGLAFTRFGSAQISTAQSKWNGSSLLLNGSTDYLTVPYAGGQFDFGTGAFIVEGWIYLANTSGNKVIAAVWPTSNPSWRFLVVDNKLSFNYENTASSYQEFISDPCLRAGKWHHVAVCHDGTTIRLFVQGVLVLSFARVGTIRAASSALNIGRNESGSTWFFNGNINSLRILKPETIYTQSFGIPTAAFGADPDRSSTSLLLPCNGTNGGTSFPDLSPGGLTVTANGNAQTSTAQSKWGGSSALFDGAGDYLGIPTTAALEFGTGNYTVELWFYIAGNAAVNGVSQRDATLLSKFVSAGSVDGWQINIAGDASTTGTGIVLQQAITSSQEFLTWTGTISQNAWHFLRMSRSGTVTKIELDGATIITGTLANQNMSAASYGLKVGGRPYPSFDNYFNGYIDDLRLTKGVARTGPVPLRPFPPF